MEAIRPLLVKYIYIAAITIIFLTYLPVPPVALGSSLVIAFFVTLVLYFAGDRFMLPRFGSAATAVANFVLAALVLALANLFVAEPFTTASLLAAAAVMGVAEWLFFHYARSEVAAEAEAAGIPGEFLGELTEAEGEFRQEAEEESRPGVEEQQGRTEEQDNPGG